MKRLDAMVGISVERWKLPTKTALALNTIGCQLKAGIAGRKS